MTKWSLFWQCKGGLTDFKKTISVTDHVNKNEGRKAT